MYLTQRRRESQVFSAAERIAAEAATNTVVVQYAGAASARGGHVEPMSAAELADRMRRSLRQLLVWAEAYQPRVLSERLRYDSELDEAEDLLEVADHWAALHADRDSQADGGRRR